MALWRFGRGWSEEALKGYLASLGARRPNFAEAPEEMVPEKGWIRDGAEDVLCSEPPGPPLPDGPFERARRGLLQYDFSDPRIVVGHFDPRAPLLHREMLLEIKVFGLRFLNGVRVTQVRDEQGPEATLFGYRYDTLEGHIERGCEWFLLTKDHRTGEVRLKIEARWRLGQFPNWWSRVGFRVVGRYFRSVWRREAPQRLRDLINAPGKPASDAPDRLAHRGDTSPRLTQPPP